MYPVLLRWGRVTLYSYPTLLYIGIVCGIAAQQAAARRIGLDATQSVAATLILLLPALAGARLLFVFAHWRIYRKEPRNVWRSSEGGAAMYGGLLLAVPLSVPLLMIMQVPFGQFWDVASLTILVGMFFARIGCLLNGCCAGRPTNGWFGFTMPDRRGVWTRRIPTQILEAVWGLAVLAGAIAFWDRSPFPGAVFAYTLGAYGAGRIVLESTRQHQTQVLGITLQRAISTGFVAIAVATFAFMWLRALRP